MSDATDEATTVEHALFVRGEVRSPEEPTAFIQREAHILGSFLQVKHLTLLLGAGPSYPLGSPRIRSMTMDDLGAMLDRADEPALAEGGGALVRGLVDRAGGHADLEAILAALSAASSLMHSIVDDGDALSFGGVQATRDQILDTRRTLNRALAHDCDLPRLEETAEALKSDPLLHHREFFRKLLAARRFDLPRVKMFTTNYDLVLEKALDSLGIAYFDGFAGGVTRVFRPESYDRDLYVPPEEQSRRLLRVPDVLYLFKLHGSINWRSRRLRGNAEDSSVVQVGSPLEFDKDEYAIIYPTPEKEIDVLGYPYSALFRALSEALMKPDAALLVVGYGFSDAHINRMIMEALSSPSFQMLVVSPAIGEVNAGRAVGEGPLPRIARLADARIQVVGGSEAGLFSHLAMEGMPDAPEPAAEPTLATTAEMGSILTADGG